MTIDLETIPDRAFVSKAVLTRWETLSEAQREVCATILTTWLDEMAWAGFLLSRVWDNATDASQVRDSLRDYFRNLGKIDTSSQADLQAIFGIHCPAGDERRALFFHIAHLSNPTDQTKQ